MYYNECVVWHDMAHTILDLDGRELPMVQIIICCCCLLLLLFIPNVLALPFWLNFLFVF